MATEESSQSQQSKWEGKLCAEIKGATAEQVWPLLEDFFNLHKWLPELDICEPVEGVSGQPGCIRYCSKKTTTSPPPGSSESEEKKVTTTIWAKERLLVIDPVERYLTYEINENNMEMKFYKATMKVLQLSNEGCQIEWSFVADPVEGWTFEDLLSFVHSNLQGMAHKMEDAFCRTPTSL